MISIVIPTMDRAERLKNCLQSIKETTPAGSYELLIYTKYHYSPVVKWNWGARDSRGDWLMLGADDLIFHPGWYEAFMDNNHSGFVGPNDGSGKGYGEEYVPHYIVSRQFCIDYLGGVLAIPRYVCWWFDREVCDRAKSIGAYIFIEDCLIEHIHPDWGKAARDDTHASHLQFHEIDRRLYERRKEQEFPNDYEPIMRPLEVLV